MLPFPSPPIDKETYQDQEERAAGHLRFVNPNVGRARRWNYGYEHGEEGDGQAANTSDQSAGRAAGNNQPILAFGSLSAAMDDEAKEKIEVRNEIDKKRHIQQDEKSPLNRSSLAQDGE
jgi:hypothetical protein